MLRVTSSERQVSWNMMPWREFEGISYDPITGTLDVKVGGFDHQIENPAMIWAGTQPDGTVERVLVLRRDGSKDEVTFSKYRFPFSGVVYDARPPGGRGLRSPDRAKTGAKKRLWGRLVRRAD